MSVNIDELYNMAIQAINKKQNRGAKVMLRQILSQDKRNDRAMLALAKIAKTDKEKRYWLNQALKIDPENKQAQKELYRLDTHDEAERNKLLFNVGVAGGAVVIILINIVLLITMTN